MGMPNISIKFTTAAQTAVRRSQAGVVAVILLDAAASGALSIASAKQIPTTLTAANQAYLQRAFIGYTNPPSKVLCYVLDDEAAELTAALTWLATQQFDYLAGPPEITVEQCTAVKAWISSQRSDNHAIYKAVLPDTSADSEAIINFTTEGIKVGTATYDAADYCSRIAGMLAGTPMTYSCTYAELPEVEDVTRLTASAMDTAVDAGKFLLFFDGRQVKTGRAVNSLQTLTGKSAAYKKIKVVEALDMIQTDIRRLCEDNYIGRLPNSYDNKLLLVTELRNYLVGLEAAGVLKAGASTVALDVDAQQAWLESKGVDTSSMTEAEILQADTESLVFLKASVRILDAIEDITLQISI